MPAATFHEVKIHLMPIPTLPMKSWMCYVNDKLETVTRELSYRLCAITGRFLRNIRIVGNNVCNGLGTTVKDTDTTLRYVYGFDIRGISVQSVDEAYVFQALWHTTIDNCTSAACRIGMHFWGQNVSNHVSGCHMRRTQLSQLPNSFGYLINPRTYAYAPGLPKRSEAIIIDGESMAIGFDTGIRLTDGLDMHFSNLDLDYCWTYGISIANVNATFTLTDSWVAADATNTGQFIGVHVTTPPGLVQKKVFSSINFSCANANSLNNNIAINLQSGNDYVTISDLTVNNGKYSVFARDCEQCLVQNSVLSAEIYLDACKDWSISDTRVSGLTEINKPSGSFNNYYRTTGTPALNGIMSIPMSAGATSANATIVNGSASLTYIARKWDRNSAASDDKISVSGVIISVVRPVAVGTSIGTYVEYTAI